MLLGHGFEYISIDFEITIFDMSTMFTSDFIIYPHSLQITWNKYKEVQSSIIRDLADTKYELLRLS